MLTPSARYWKTKHNIEKFWALIKWTILILYIFMLLHNMFYVDSNLKSVVCILVHKWRSVICILLVSDKFPWLWPEHHVISPAHLYCVRFLLNITGLRGDRVPIPVLLEHTLRKKSRDKRMLGIQVWVHIVLFCFFLTYVCMTTVGGSGIQTFPLQWRYDWAKLWTWAC